MRYDFTTMPDRRGKDAIALDMIGKPGGFAPAGPKEGFSPIPMWVADMNFLACPAIQEAVIRRTEHPAFGYFEPSEAYFDSIIRWHRLRNGVEGLEPRHIGYENGVLGGVISTLNVLCSRGDPVLLQSPTYVGFTHVLENNGYEIVHNPMYRDEQGVWRIDYEDLERKITERHIHATIFCSPHNPCGRVWERWEIEQAMAIFERHQVWVVSDEIWSDLILDGHKHIPTQSVSPWARAHTAAMYAPSKTFNLAGLQGSYHIIYNDYLRDRVSRQSALPVYNAMNVLSMHALIGAYKPEGEEWLDQLRTVLTKNVDFACDFIHENFKGVEVSHPQGTYMLLLDCHEWLEEHGKTLDELLESGVEVGILWQDGRQFNRPDSIRLNLALPFSRVEEAFRRMKEYVF